MKLFFFIFNFFLFGSYTFGQINDRSDLRIKVDSIILHQLGYVIDFTTNKMPSLEWDSTLHRGMYPSFSNYPKNPMTLILFNGRSIEIEELNSYKMSDINYLEVYRKNDPEAVIQGLKAKNVL